MWKYSQSTGELFGPNGDLIDTGYAGKGADKNDPDKQCVADSGPIPRGFYTCQPAINHPKLGPVAVPLKADAGNDMCGRTGFYIHGDKVPDPGNASEGCIIMKRSTRESVDKDGDKRLQVVRASMLSRRLQRQKGDLASSRDAKSKKPNKKGRLKRTLQRESPKSTR